MKIDLCALTEDLLPLYVDDLLSPPTRQLLEEHSESCPACRQRLQEGKAAPPTPVPPAQPGMERAARAFFRRLHLYLYTGLAAVVVLLIIVSSLSYSLGRRSPWEREMIPARVGNAEEVARRAIPGWERAAAHGLVVDIGITERIPRTDATVTVEKAWYSGRQAYVLYTVKAPEGGYWMPVEAFLRGNDPERPVSDGGAPWHLLSTWGGFSPEGFHSILIFDRVPQTGDTPHLELVLWQWVQVDPESGTAQSGGFREEVPVLLTWDPAYMLEPEPEIIPWPQRHTWLGRTLALEQLAVGIGRMQLTGEIALPEGERDPVLMATLVVGGQEIEGGDYTAEPTGEPGRYRFTATFDGPDRWPAPVELRLRGISFATDQALEWPVHWAKYRHLTARDRRLMDPEDQVTVRFYDSELVSISTIDSGVAIEQRDPDRKPPYVRAGLRGGGRGVPPDLHAGFEVVNDAGEVLTNLGGGGGVIWSDPGRGERHGVSVRWWDVNDLPESFRESEWLLIRYVQPSAALILDETWHSPAGS